MRSGHRWIKRRRGRRAVEAPDARDALIKRAKDGEKVSAKTEGKKVRREQREIESPAKILALPEKKYGVVLWDYEWDHETWSERGKDRHASNHYSTSADAHTADEIVARTKERFDCAADDCVLFMWVTSPFLDIAMDVLRLRGFTYKTTIMWDKVVDGTGYWFRNRHEQMLRRYPRQCPGACARYAMAKRDR